MKTTPTRSVSMFTEASNSRRVWFARMFTVLLLLGLAGRASGQGTVPEYLSLQGYMEDASGVPLGQTTPTNYSVVFRIYPLATGGTLSWSESQNVTFEKGNYSVLLGQGQNLSGPNLSAVVANASGSELYVESTVTINGTPATILPRLRLLPTPYAFLAKKSLSAASADQALSVNGSAIAAGSIQQDRLSASVNSNILSAPISASRISGNIDSLISTNITQGPVAVSRIVGNLDSLISTNITQGPIADSRLSNNVARRNTDNSFTGNQTITGKLTNNGDVTVNGRLIATNDVKFGAAAQFSAVGSIANLQIISGILPANPNSASSANGPGWSAVGLSSNPGYWKVTFATAFPSPSIPMVFATWILDSPTAWNSDNPSSPVISITDGTSFITKANTTANGAFTKVHFMAIGPR